MLRKRSTAAQGQSKGGLMGDLASDSSFSSDSVAKQKSRSASFFSIPSLLVNLAGKGLSDSDSLRSPTSPLDYMLFSNFSCSLLRSPRSPGKSWQCGKVGLGLVGFLRDDDDHGRCSENKNILLGSQMRISNITSQNNNFNSIGDEHPKNKGSYVSQMNSSKEELVEDEQIDSYSADATLLTHKNPKSNSDVFALGLKSSPLSSLPFVDGRPVTNNLSGSLPASVESMHSIMGYLSASEMELSEDYTCIISHGTNPKTTHIFGDCILKSYTIEASDSNTKKLEESGSSHWIIKCLEDSPTFGSGNFLSFCFFCHKNLEDGKDIYMYRGEKAFCSCKCRDQLMLIEEKWESAKLATSSS